MESYVAKGMTETLWLYVAQFLGIVFTFHL